jgi:gluconate 5-dehydrogenase
MEQFRLNNKISLITGGSRGIGFGIASALAAAGSDIVLVARAEAQLEHAKEKLSRYKRKIWTYPYDMNNVDGIHDIYACIIADTGSIDVLVNNAGGTRRGPAEAITAEDWNFVINLNLSAVFALCQAFGKERIPYAASKGGIRQLTKALAVDWAKYDINVNAIGPGFIRTELTRPLWEDEMFDNWLKRKTPQGRWGNPEDIGYAAVFLASPASDYITGQILYVDGGLLSTFGPVY